MHAIAKRVQTLSFVGAVLSGAMLAGPPQLMMAFTADGQLHQELLDERDQRYGISTADKRRQREQLDLPERVLPGADHWQSGDGSVWQVTMEQVPFKPSHNPEESVEPASSVKS